MKFIHAADIHLDSPLRGLERYDEAPVEEIREATRLAFVNLIKLAVEQQVDFVVLAGDLYDGDWPDFSTGLFFTARMYELQQAGIQVYLLAGNHDAASQITKNLHLPDNVHKFGHKKPETFVIDGLDVALHGQSFAKRAVTEDLSINYPKPLNQHFNIGVLHTSLSGTPEHEPYAPCKQEALQAKGYQYWALGHVHQRQVISEDPWIVFPGNIQGRHIRESGAKGCTLVSVEQHIIQSVVHCDLDVMRWCRVEIDINQVCHESQLLAELREALDEQLTEAEGRPIAVRLKVVGKSPLHRELKQNQERWQNEFRALATGISGAGIWLEKIEIHTSAAAGDSASSVHDENFLGFVESLTDELDDQVLTTALAAELLSLQQKLPAEIRGEEDPTAPEQFAKRLPEIRELLVQRLMQAGDA